MRYQLIENNLSGLIIAILLIISLGGLAEIVPLFFMNGSTDPNIAHKKIEHYSALRLEGRDIYIREGCMSCHSQMIRKSYSETERYGAYSIAAESIYDYPALWGSKRNGPDLARIGKRYSDAWQQEHLKSPNSMILGSIMPSYSWLEETTLDGTLIVKKMLTINSLIKLTCPKCKLYSEQEIAAAPAKVNGKTEAEALIAYLNGDLEQTNGLGR